MEVEGRKIKVMIAKPGLDGHDRGARVLCRFLRDAGFEVIYTGLHRTAGEIANSALQEDVDVLGLSFLSGAHESYVPRIRKLMEERGVDMDEIVYLVGGIIPEEHFEKLLDEKIDGIFIPGSPIQDVVDFIGKKIEEIRGEGKKNEQYYLGTSLSDSSELR